MLETHCYECHSDGVNEGEVALDRLGSIEAARADADTWALALRAVRSGLMPPPEEARPSPEAIAAMARWVKDDLMQLDPEDPGPTPPRRMNGTEFRNALAFLLHLELDSIPPMPADDTGEGFDTMGNLLGLSPIWLEDAIHADRKSVV